MGKIFCIGQSAYDITIPLSGPIVENQKYRVEEKIECGEALHLTLPVCAASGERMCA